MRGSIVDLGSGRAHSDRSGPIAFGAAATAMTALPDKAEDFERYVVPELEVLYRAALAITRDRSEAEDLVQDTLVRAFRGLHGFDGEHPRAWLLTILRNTNISRHRRRRPELLDDPDRIRDLVASTPAQSGPEYDATVAVLDAKVERAFLSLSDAQQAAVRLVDMDGLSYREAADVLGVPIGTVMSQLHRGRKRIRRKLAGSALGARRR